ncbi:MAG: hypothetical protein QOG56_1844, partial [Solirubrobacteraceae bacterium]|nr:hypothetical protein [Solirubrobacteraceae bacterium]
MRPPRSASILDEQVNSNPIRAGPLRGEPRRGVNDHGNYHQPEDLGTEV